jgi:hypothetical protein
VLVELPVLVLSVFHVETKAVPPPPPVAKDDVSIRFIIGRSMGRSIEVMTASSSA